MGLWQLPKLTQVLELLMEHCHMEQDFKLCEVERENRGLENGNNKKNDAYSC